MSPDSANPLLEWARILYGRRWLAGAVVLVIVGVAAARTFTATPIYQAQAKVLIESDAPRVVSFEEVLDEGEARANYYQTQYELLASRALARKTVNALDLWKREDFGGTGPVNDAAEKAARESSAVNALLRSLYVAPVRGSRIVNLRFQSADPALAVTVVNAHARQYIEQALEVRFRVSREASDWLQAQLAEERKRVQQSESALQAYREQHDAVALGEGQDIVAQKLADLNAALTRAKTDRIQKQGEYRQLLGVLGDRAKLDSSPAILASAFIQQLKVDLARLQREHAQLEATLGARHPMRMEKASALATTEARIDAEVAKVVESALNEFRTALAQEASLTQALNEQKTEALGLNRRGIEYAALAREAESIRIVYESLLQRAKETSVSGELRASNIRIIDYAELPRTPVAPRKALTLLMALLGGSMFALALVFGLAYVDDRIRTPDDMRRRLGLPFLGLLSEVTPRGARGAVLTAAESPAFREAIRAVRTNVVAAADGGAQALMVASAAPGDGKTLVACNLAIALARINNRVLLIDADMRRPAVHEAFGQPLEPGLSDVLSGGVSAMDALRTTSFSGLQTLAGGASTLDAPELLASQRYIELLNTLKGKFDWIVVDSPPVLNVTDAGLAGRGANGIVLVVAAGKTKARDARHAVSELELAGGRVLGVVVNRADVEHNAFTYSPYAHGEYGPSAEASISPPHMSSPSLLGGRS